MRHHPEQLEDEIYMGNTSVEDLHRSNWRTSRLGRVPITAFGTRLAGDRLLPWFIKSEEVAAKIEFERQAAKPWSQSRINDLQPMLTSGTAIPGVTPVRYDSVYQMGFEIVEKNEDAI